MVPAAVGRTVLRNMAEVEVEVEVERLTAEEAAVEVVEAVETVRLWQRMPPGRRMSTSTQVEAEVEVVAAAAAGVPAGVLRGGCPADHVVQVVDYRAGPGCGEEKEKKYTKENDMWD